jgi:hypothetical protein
MMCSVYVLKLWSQCLAGEWCDSVLLHRLYLPSSIADFKTKNTASHRFKRPPCSTVNCFARKHADWRHSVLPTLSEDRGHVTFSGWMPWLYVECEGSLALPPLQSSSVWLDPEPDKSIPHPNTLFLEKQFHYWIWGSHSDGYEDFCL